MLAGAHFRLFQTNCREQKRTRVDAAKQTYSNGGRLFRGESCSDEEQCDEGNFLCGEHSCQRGTLRWNESMGSAGAESVTRNNRSSNCDEVSEEALKLWKIEKEKLFCERRY